MYADSSSQTCETCDATCATCFAGNAYSCLSCESSRIFNQAEKQCVLECPEGTYQTLNTDSLKVCSLCNTECAKCFDSADNCSSCQIGYYLFEKNCITTCKDGYYAKTNPRECILCDDTCLTCVGGFNYNCLTCNVTNGFILVNELDQNYGTCTNQSNLLSSIETESANFNEDNYASSQSVASQANVICNVLTTAELNDTATQSATKTVKQFTELANKKSKNIKTEEDAVYLVDSISQLNNVTGVTSEDSLNNSVEALNNVIENEDIPMDKSLFGKMVSGWSNTYERNQEVIDKAATSKKEKKKKKQEFNAKLAQNNDKMISSLKMAMLGSSDEQIEFTTKSNAMTAKVKKVKKKAGQDLNLDIKREDQSTRLRQRILTVKRGLQECQEVTNIGEPLVTLDDGCMEQLPTTILLVQFINYQMNVFSKYIEAQDIKSNIVLYTIIDGSTYNEAEIESAHYGYLTIDIPLQELVCDSENNELVCVRWDDQIKDWSDKEINTISSSDLYVQCQTRKLGYFAVVEKEKFSINREVQKNYGFMAVWFIMILGIFLFFIGIAMSIGHQQPQSINTSKFSEYEQMQYSQGKVRKFKESFVPLTISPVLSLFLSQTISDYIKKIVQFTCYIMAYMFYLSIFYNIESWNISDDVYLMVPLPLLSIFITWVCNYVLGFIRMKINLPIYYIIALIYYAGMSVGISFNMKGSTDDRSNKFVYSSLIGLIIDLIIFDSILIIIAKVLSLPKKRIWNIFIMSGFAEDEFAKISQNVKQIFSEENYQGLKGKSTEQQEPQVEIIESNQSNIQQEEKQEIQEEDLKQEELQELPKQQENDQQQINNLLKFEDL